MMDTLTNRNGTVHVGDRVLVHSDLFGTFEAPLVRLTHEYAVVIRDDTETNYFHYKIAPLPVGRDKLSAQLVRMYGEKNG